ncbi:hypothetical protein TRFO_21452 [Tritrichomonas foetus]|uniref:Ubiquitin-like domain-containing protein n=1 Tax=Tritrichomonas foetus TaxID=1144522 RepID=A0A1J4KJX3_9EUKA|nr:hypothetical protein TRFO_21452 [Tritrichomonas foetus]|eukprot:OHT09637.1 hypothetical protein TRFO_21452 [Tritrichomonas foetus]
MFSSKKNLNENSLEMNKELKVRVQWSRGTILPVLTKGTATAAELSRLLRFACSPLDEVVLLHNGVPLNPDLSLECQLIKDNDILEAFIVRKTSGNSDGLASKINSIVFEAARVADRHFNALENEPYRPEPKKKSSSDDDYFDLLETDNNYDRDSKATITSEPLPTFWVPPKTDPPDVLNKYVPTKVSSIEEAGQFLEKQGWSSWMW